VKKAAIAFAAVAVMAAAGPAAANTTTVSIIDHAYVPPRLAVLTGDTVGWRNTSFVNQHTVTGSGFDSGPIVSGGGFFLPFNTAGTYHYACTIHPFMTGDVDVSGLLLEGPGRAVARGAPTALTGRAAAGIDSVTVQEDTGAGFHAVAGARVAAGAFKATVRPPGTAAYRVVAGANESPPVVVQVSDKSDIRLRRRGRRLRVSVYPANPGARVSLQLKLRERFGWWTVARERLDARSRATFRLRRHGRASMRVVLTRQDGWTPLAISSPLGAP
jgi:plastocyanin